MCEEACGRSKAPCILSRSFVLSQTPYVVSYNAKRAHGGIESTCSFRLQRATLAGGINHIEAVLMAAAVERSFKPDTDDSQREFERNHSLTEREDIGIIMAASEPGGFLVPAEGTANAFHTIGDNGFPIPRTAEDDATFKFSAGDRFGNGADEQWIVCPCFRVGPEVLHGMSLSGEHGANLFFVLEPGMVRTDGNFHERSKLARRGKSRQRETQGKHALKSWANLKKLLRDSQAEVGGSLKTFGSWIEIEACARWFLRDRGRNCD